MGVEIERRFLVAGDGWRQHVECEELYCQGYIHTVGDATVRVRRAGDAAYLTIKGPKDGSVRPEFEYSIPVDDAEDLFRLLCGKPLVEKVRHRVPAGRCIWYVDVFAGANTGLVVAEVELSDEHAEVPLPDWVGDEVTNDGRYRNSALAGNSVPDCGIAHS